MKKIFITPLIILFISTSCKKESPAKITEPPPQIPPPGFPVNTAPKVFGGSNLQVITPVDSCILVASAADAESNIASYSWRKITGPASYNIESPDSLVTKVRNLKRGTYVFELTVTDKGNMSGKDTIVVSVIDSPPAGSKEMLFQNLQWQCPMGCSIFIQDFTSYIPSGKPFIVYIKNQNSYIWFEVPHESKWAEAYLYVYSMYNNHFLIYTNDEDYASLWEIKVVY